MRELRHILEAWERSARRGEEGGAVLATVVHTEGSTYRSAGARLWVEPDGTTLGLISGGCLEGDLQLRAAEVRERNRAELVRYDATRDDDVLWGLGLGCAGIVDVLLEPVSKGRPGPLGWLAAWRSARARGALATSLEPPHIGRRWALHPDGRLEGPPISEALHRALADARREGHARTFSAPEGLVAVEGVAPPLRLVVFGAGPDAIPVARLAQDQGWDVELADPRSAFARADRFPEARVHCVPAHEAVESVGVDADTFALVMNHHYLHDRAVLADLLGSNVAYVGLLGPKRRAEDLLADLAAEGRRFEDDSLARLYAPAGLDLGGEGPDAIAVSVVGEILAVSQGRRGGWLRDRKGPINDPETA